MDKGVKIASLLLIVTATILIGFFYLRNDSSPMLKVESPKKGDVVTIGSQQTIKWTSKNIPKENKISVSLRRVPPPPLETEGQEFDPLLFINLPNTGSTNWTVSDMYPDGDYVLTITSYSSTPVKNPIIAESDKFRIQSSAQVSNLECHDSPKYFVVEEKLPNSPGSNILVKYKSDPSDHFPCKYTPQDDDFELKDALAEYFLALSDNFLILDKGTAPEPRKLIVYDLRARKESFTDLYAKPVEISGDTITYFSKTEKEPTIENCPDLDTYTAQGLGAAILSKITVDLSTNETKSLDMFKCIPTQ